MPALFKTALCIITFVCLSLAGISQSKGKVFEEKTIESTILSKKVKYAIYLPPDYEQSERTYPVVYLLHGYTDDHTGWLQFGEIDRLANAAIADGTIPPMIIVMPNGDSGFFINSYDGKENYENFFTREFMPAIEKTYRIKAEKRYRGIAGLSMGGYGTLIYSLKYPDLFAAAAPLSAGIHTDDEMTGIPDARWDVTNGPLFGRNLKGKNRLTDAWYKNSILRIVETKTPDELKKVRYWIDCGDDDRLTVGNCGLHLLLVAKQVPHEFRVRDGGHSWGYWRSGIIDALKFIGESFHQR